MLYAGKARSLGRSPPEYRHMRRYGRIPLGLTLGPNDTDGKKREEGQVFTERSTRNLRRRADWLLGRNVSTLNYGSA